MVNWYFLELVLWIIVNISLFLISIYFLRQCLAEKDKPSEFFFLAIFFFFLCTGIQRIFSIIFDFFYPELFFLFLITLLNIISAIPLLYHLERTVIHSKKILSYIVIGLMILFVIVYLSIGYDRVLMYYFFIPPFVIVLGTIALIYFYLFAKSSGKVRTSVALIIFGMALVLGFWYVHGQYGRSSVTPLEELVDIIGIVAPLGYLIGLIILAIGFFKKKV